LTQTQQNDSGHCARAEGYVEAFVHVTPEMFSQLSPHCSSNFAAWYNLGIWVWTFVDAYKALFRAPDPTQLNSTQLAVELS